MGSNFSNFRKSTPKSVQWLLLVAAIVIVIVLLLLLMGGKKNKTVAPADDVFPTTPELRFEPNAPIDWANTLVDETRDAEIKVYSNSRVQITNLVVQVEGEKDEDIGLSANATCTNEQTFVTEDTPCLITLSYTPTHVIPRTNVGVAITWTAFDLGPDPIETPNAITAIIGAREKPKIEISAPEPVAKPEPKLTKEPEPVAEAPVEEEAEPEEEVPEEEAEEELPEEPATEFQEDIDDIAPVVDFFEPAPKSVTPSASAPAEKKYRSAFGNACSDFSFPGYNMAGIQSGWIVPSGGAYYYHPFSDTKCETATGIYNADTGYIMDISNPTRKIGSDVEHIRFTVRERMPQLQSSSKSKATAGRARQLTDAELDINIATSSGDSGRVDLNKTKRVEDTYKGSGFEDGVFSSRPYDRTFVLRQYKPIPATIVSDIQADEKLLNGGLPVRATVDRNVYSDNGRTIIIPTGTLMLGYVTGELPGPYKAVGKMQIEWYQFIRPDGVEFNFNGDKKPFSADSQGRKGVPGHGSTDYLQQFVMPMLTAVVPAAVNLIAPISDSFVNQIDLDNNTVVQSGTVRSSEMAKNEIITAWNNVATKLLVDMLDNTTPPFSIAAGTRITVFSPVDLFVTCGQDDEQNVNSKKCAFAPYPEGNDAKRADWANSATPTDNLDELIGQVRSMMQSSLKEDCCECKDGVCSADYDKSRSKVCANYSFTTLDFYCRSFGTYEAINNAKQKAVYENQKEKMSEKTNGGNVDNLTKEYNTEILGLKYDDDGKIKDPFKTEKKEKAPAAVPDSSVITCDNGAHPDANGCCPGETYTDMGDQGFNCCPDAGGDCFPPIEM